MNTRLRPTAQELPYSDPVHYFLSFADQDGTVFLDSATTDSTLGRYSYIAFDPVECLVLTDEQIGSGAVFDKIEQQLLQFTLDPIPDLPPFQGGLAGFLSYDLARDIELLPQQAIRDQPYPVLCLGVYHLVISFDHQLKKTWLISSGFFSNEKLEYLLARLLKVDVHSGVNVLNTTIDAEAVSSDMTQQQYEDAVRKAINYITAGDIFEVNLSQRFQCELPASFPITQLYHKLRQVNPAPFSAYARFSDTAILSSSPERFLQVKNSVIETRPIKGTIKRSLDTAEDQQLAQQLLASEKDRAENIMIVDLMRNDLSRVCLPRTIAVPQLCGLESYKTVHHLVSVVRGQLDPDINLIDVLRATFPGGSITGAPKVRAMEIIDELEPTRRGPYCGSMVYLGFDGCMDSSILIRSYVVQGSHLSFQGGGAIVLDSDPLSEYKETLAKTAVLQSLLTSGGLSP